MLRPGRWLVGALLVGVVTGCTGSPSSGSREEPKPSVASVAAAAMAPDHEGGAITWRSWEEGREMARARRRPICLLVYANWCPHCRALMPVFSRPDVVALGRRMVMVKQDSDAHPAWLAEKLGAFGGYIPRLFFLDPDGQVLPDYTSGHPRYPYFYTPDMANRLVTNMKAVLGG